MKNDTVVVDKAMFALEEVETTVNLPVPIRSNRNTLNIQRAKRRRGDHKMSTPLGFNKQFQGKLRSCLNQLILVNKVCVLVRTFLTIETCFHFSNEVLEHPPEMLGIVFLELRIKSIGCSSVDSSELGELLPERKGLREVWVPMGLI